MVGARCIEDYVKRSVGYLDFDLMNVEIKYFINFFLYSQKVIWV
jgi:hypothetical protein